MVVELSWPLSSDVFVTCLQFATWSFLLIERMFTPLLAETWERCLVFSAVSVTCLQFATWYLSAHRPPPVSAHAWESCLLFSYVLVTTCSQLQPGSFLLIGRSPVSTRIRKLSPFLWCTRNNMFAICNLVAFCSTDASLSAHAWESCLVFSVFVTTCSQFATEAFCSSETLLLCSLSGIMVCTLPVHLQSRAQITYINPAVVQYEISLQ